tara:strand:+ start:1323 stop:1877 length:555 start_codon:yes stop_codon:yes gene_type:complete
MATWKEVLTSGTKQKFDITYAMRWYTDATPTNSLTARRRWYTPSTTYGPSSVNWTSYLTSVNPRSYWYDSFHPLIVIPRSMTLKRYTLWGNSTTEQDLLLEIKKNTNGLNWNNSAVSIPLTTVGTRQSATWGNGLFNKMQENVSVEFDEGDIIIPSLARNSLLDSTTTYFVEGQISFEFEEDIE